MKWSYNLTGLSGLYLNECDSYFIWSRLCLGYSRIFYEGIQKIEESEVEIA